MEESQAQSQRTTSPGDQATPSELRLRSSGGEDHVVYSSESARDASSDGGSNCAKYKLMSPAKLPISRSPCITIPPGLSPTSFLESPVLLSNMKAEPSPTTGSFSEYQLIQGSGSASALSLTASYNNSDSFKDWGTDCFEFKPHTGCNSFPAGAVISSGLNHQRRDQLAQVQDHVQSQSLRSLPSGESEMAATTGELTLSALNATSAARISASSGVDSDELSQREPLINGVPAPQADSKDVGPSATSERSPEDGYNWRKYGQKLVKGCEFPRSYYKCTHPNCEVKKIFERAYDGQITEIVYKGTHDHPKPQPSRRFMGGTIMSLQEKSDKNTYLTGQEDKSNTNGKILHNLDSYDTPEQSPHRTSDDNVEGAVSQLNSVNDEVDEDDPFSKRRKMEGDIDVTAVVKPIREPRVVVQTVSEVDILDDGYRWRKYGQKVVRGNPNPRSYYKCTNAGCPVRKHVERASHDPKAVITTYEGKHNHDVPAGKTNSHDVTGTSSVNGGGSRSRLEAGVSGGLNLGVGMGSGAENRSGQQNQTPNTEHLHGQIHSMGSSFGVGQFTQASAHYAVINNGGHMFGATENRVDGHKFETPNFNHSSNPHPMNIGRLLLGPYNCSQ